MHIQQKIDFLYNQLLSERTKKRGENTILTVAILSYLIHLSIIYLVRFDFIGIHTSSELLKNPIAAIYTPFSFILVYEVYLLIYYLPKSITTYIGKQYEIITLIIIRRLFKDLSNLSLSNDWFKINYDLQFTYDLIASLLLFFLIYLFLKQRQKKFRTEEELELSLDGINRFIVLKKVLAVLLVLVIVMLAVYSFLHWLLGMVTPDAFSGISFKNINNVFFEQFFSILIIADVILLLFSFFHTDEFHKVIRNSGFVISTILIRISFSVSGILNTALIVSAIVFGLIILVLYNKFEEAIVRENNSH
jgi:hypothetical protein